MKYFTKLSDLNYYGPKARRHPGSRLISAGYLMGGGQDEDYKSRRDFVSNMLIENAKKGISLRDIKKAYMEKYPDDIINYIGVHDTPTFMRMSKRKRFKELAANPSRFIHIQPLHSHPGLIYNKILRDVGLRSPTRYTL